MASNAAHAINERRQCRASSARKLSGVTPGRSRFKVTLRPSAAKIDQSRAIDAGKAMAATITLFPSARTTCKVINAISAGSWLRKAFVVEVEAGTEPSSARPLKNRIRDAITPNDQRHRTSVRTITDRKSTRLNSSHQIISYAVFCLKKK